MSDIDTFDRCVRGVALRVDIGRCCACTLPKYADTIGVASERCNIVLDPLDSSLLVKQSKILRIRGMDELRSIRLPKDVKAIVESDDDEVVAISNEETAILNGQSALSDCELVMGIN